MKTRTLTPLSLIVIVSLLLTSGASPIAAQALSGPPLAPAPRSDMWTANLDAPLQTDGQCSVNLGPPSSSSGRVRGQVLTAQGMVGANMRVQLLLPDGSIARTTRTDSQGNYRFSGLPTGHYQLRVADELGKPLALEAQVGLDIRPEHSQGPAERTLVLAAPILDHNADAVIPPLPRRASNNQPGYRQTASSQALSRRSMNS